MKKKICVLLSLILLFTSMVNVSMFAADELSIGIGSVTAVKGETVTLTVSISSNPGFIGLNMYLIYPEELTLLDAANKAESLSFTRDKTLVWDGGEDYKLSGDLLVLTFAVSDNAKVGDTYEVRLNCIEAFNDNNEDLAVSLTSGTVHVSCSHINTENTAMIPATCKDIGYTAGVYCNDCQKYISGHDVIPVSTIHTYGAWENNDSNTHKHICTICGTIETAAHSWDAGKVTTEPTHLTEGEKTYTCTVCGASRIEKIKPTDEHSFGVWEKHNETQHKHTCACGAVEYENHKWNAGEVTKAPTCKDTGIKTYTCTVCGETKTETLPIIDTHTWGEWTKGTADEHKRICSICGKSETAAHSWDEGRETKPATHLTEGEKTYTCTVCGATKIEKIKPTDEHSFGVWEKHNETQHKHTCACGAVEYEDHKWNAGEVTKAPTCKDNGIKTYTCTVCGETKTETLPIIDTHKWGEWTKTDETNHTHTCSICGKVETAAHSWDEGKITTVPTCKDTGVKTYTCVCGETKTETLPITTNHTWGKCENVNADQHKHTCTVCGKTESMNHKWDSGVVTKRPTHSADGERRVTCSDCGATKTERLPKLTVHNYDEYRKYNATRHQKICICGAAEYENHKWDDGIVTTPASHIQEGVKTYTCKDCGETKTEKIEPTDEHTYGAWEKHNETQHKHTCACGEVEYADHNWNAGEVTTAPTCKDTGIKTYTCTDCGATRTETIPVTDVHSFGEWQKASETEHKHVCSVCGKEESEAHKFDDGKTCSVCGATVAAVDSSSNSGETTTQGPSVSEPPTNHTILIVVIAAVAVIAIVIVVVLVSKKKKNKE